MKNKWKNYGLWVAIASLLGMILQDVGFHIAPEKFEKYVDAVFTILVLAGIISNPSIGRGFTDKTHENK